MANITLTFSNPLPETIQVGDIAWYVDSSAAVGTGQQEFQMGPIISYTVAPPYQVVINAADGVQPPTANDFVFYVKDPIAKVGQLKGYFAEVQFRNNNTAYAELFSVGSEVFESSK